MISVLLISPIPPRRANPCPTHRWRSICWVKAAGEETLTQWKAAADDYLQAIRRFRSRVVPLQTPDSVAQDVSSRYVATRFVAVGQIVQEKLSKWPAEGLSIYNGLYGRIAADQLAAASAAASRNDIPQVLDVFWTYFATDAGKRAGVRLMDHYFDNGEFRTAAWIGGRLLSFHPNLANDQAAILYRTSLSWHLAGEDAKAKKLLDQLKTMNAAANPADPTTIAGKVVNSADDLSAALAAALAVPPAPPTTRPLDADEHPSFAEQNDVEANSSVASPAILAKTIALNSPNYAGIAPPLLKNLLASDRQELATHLGGGIIPATDAGDLFFQDGRSLYAIDLATGEPIEAWAQTYPHESGSHFKGCYSKDLFGRARNQMLTVTVSPTDVVAIMGQADRSPLLNAGVTASAPAAIAASNCLICLDRNTGVQRWSQTPADLPEAAAHLHSFEYSGTPLIVPASLLGGDSVGSDSLGNEDSLLVTARGGAESHFDYCYVVCLSCRTGAYRWSTYLGGTTRDVRQKSEHPSQMAFADGRVFVMTNLGAVAALDPIDGRPIWLNLYGGASGGANGGVNGHADRSTDGNTIQRPQTDGADPAASHHPWSPNPIFVRNGNVFFLPSDTDQLLICDGQTGTPRGSLSMSDWQNARTLLGIQGNAVIVSGDKKVLAIDWQKAVAGVNAQQATRWSADIAFDDEASVCGRGVVASDSVLVPTTHRLVRIVNGRIRATYPARGSLGDDQARGNLLATDEQIVIAGPARTDVYETADKRR